MTDTNLFGEPEPAAPKPAAPKKPAVKPLESWQYYTLTQAAKQLKMHRADAVPFLTGRAMPLEVPTLTPETEAIYSRADIDKLAVLAAAFRGANGQGREG